MADLKQEGNWSVYYINDKVVFRETMVSFMNSFSRSKMETKEALERTKFLVENGAYIVNERADSILSIACECAPKEIIEYLLAQPRDRSNMEEDMAYYTNCLMNKHLNADTLLEVWQLLVKNKVPQSTMYCRLLYMTFLSSVSSICTDDTKFTLQRLEFVHEHADVIKPNLMCHLYLEPIWTPIMQWMAEHKIEPEPFTPQVTTPEEFQALSTQIKAFGFTTPEKYIYWIGWFYEILRHHRFELAVYVLTIYADRFEKLPWDCRMINSTFSKERKITEEAIDFLKTYVLPKLTPKDVRWWLSQHDYNIKTNDFYQKLATILKPYSEDPKTVTN